MKKASMIELETGQINFAALMAQFQSGIALVDVDNRLVYVNPGLIGLLGYSEEEMIHQPISAFIHSNQHRFLLKKLKSAKFDENVFNLINFVRKDEQKVECLLSYSKFQFEYDGFQGAAILVFDLHKEQDLSALLNEQQLHIAHELSSLNQIITEIARTQDLEQLLSLVFSSIKSVTGFDGGGFFVFRSDEPTLFAYPQGKFITLPSELVNGLRQIRSARPDLLRSEIHILSEINQSSQQIQLQKAFFSLIQAESSQDPTAVIVFNFKDSKRTNGIFGFFHHSINAFTQNMIEMADILTTFAAVAIENMYLLNDKEIFATLQERLRLSRELHDTVAQGLYSLILYGEASRRALTANKIAVVEENLEEMIQLSRETMQDLRLLIFELRPPLVEEVGFLGAIIARLEAVEKRSGIHAECNIYGESNLTSEVENELFKIVQEALNNVLKHAKAENMCVDIHFISTSTLVIIKDDGVGFKTVDSGSSSGLGLKSMAERVARMGGKFIVESEIGQGTTIEIAIDNK